MEDELPLFKNNSTALVRANNCIENAYCIMKVLNTSECTPKQCIDKTQFTESTLHDVLSL
jgi:hypothetical protein